MSGLATIFKLVLFSWAHAARSRSALPERTRQTEGLMLYGSTGLWNPGGVGLVGSHGSSDAMVYRWHRSMH